MITYLSPTSFIRYLNCAHHVKLLKVDQVLGRGDGDDQTMAMATGTAFDAMVKARLNRRVRLAEVLAREVRDKNKAALLVAEELMGWYEKGPLQALQAEGIAYEGVDKESLLTWTDGLGKTWESWCRGMPDLVLTRGNIVDWKVSGAFSSRGALPKEGWARCFSNGEDLGAHFRHDDLKLEEVDRAWAIQTYLYARLLGHVCGEPLRAGIENICVSNRNDVHCASYRNEVGREFQEWCERSFHQAYHALVSGTTDPPHYHDKRCVQYGKTCPVAQHCEAYRGHQQQIGVPGQSLLSPQQGRQEGEVQVGGEGMRFLVKGADHGVQPDRPLPPDRGGDGPPG